MPHRGRTCLRPHLPRGAGQVRRLRARKAAGQVRGLCRRLRLRAMLLG